MTRKGRKYNLNVTEALAHGLGSCYTEGVEYSLLGGFSITCGTPSVTCTYPTLTTCELQTLPTLEYDERVMAFLDYMNVPSVETKEALFSDATIDNPPECNEYFCLLNENFLVYIFLTGIRVVNVGAVNGEVQYKVYPENGDPDSYAWQTNATFLNLDLNGIYVIEVRDYYNNEEICKVSQIQSLADLTQPTTITLSSKLVRLFQITEGTSATQAYKTGCFEIDPDLSAGECVQINYTANASFIGAEGSSIVNISCTPNGCTTSTSVGCITDTNGVSPRYCSITACAGDTLQYNVIANSVSYGANANANFCMTTVGGLGTIEASIDDTCCSSSVSCSMAYLPIEVNLTDTVTSNPSDNSCVITGCINFTPEIPVNYYVDVEFSGLTETVVGNSIFSFATGTTTNNYVNVCTTTSNVSESVVPTIRVAGGQCSCYKITLNAPSVGSCTCGEMCINDSSAAYGIQSSVSSVVSEKCVSGNIEHPPEEVVFSMCRSDDTFYNRAGSINIETIPITQWANVRLCYAYCIGLPACGNSATIEVCRKRPLDATYNTICTISSQAGSPINGCIDITAQCGDLFLYDLTVNSSEDDDEVGADLNLNNVISNSTGINPTFNVEKYYDFVGVSPRGYAELP